MQLTKLQYHLGTTTESLTARIHYNGRGVNVRFNCLNDELIIYRGYLIPREELKPIIKILKDFFHATYKERSWPTLPKMIQFDI